jgi:hypothetical protein
MLAFPLRSVHALRNITRREDTSGPEAWACWAFQTPEKAHWGLKSHCDLDSGHKNPDNPSQIFDRGTIRRIGIDANGYTICGKLPDLRQASSYPDRTVWQTGAVPWVQRRVSGVGPQRGVASRNDPRPESFRVSAAARVELARFTHRLAFGGRRSPTWLPLEQTAKASAKHSIPEFHFFLDCEQSFRSAIDNGSMTGFIALDSGPKQQEIRGEFGSASCEHALTESVSWGLP